MIIDPIGDLLTRIRNAYLARIIDVKIPYSKIKSDILKILKKNKYIRDLSSIKSNKKSITQIGIKTIYVSRCKKSCDVMVFETNFFSSDEIILELK